MTNCSAVFDTFTLERSYPELPARVFAIFANPNAKSALTDDSDEGTGEGASYLEFDFRIGGRERFDFTESDGRKMYYDALYYDLVEDQRIVYSYEMYADGSRISVSVATIQFAAENGGTKVSWTEQGVYLDGLDEPELRQGGTSWMLDNLGEVLSKN